MEFYEIDSITFRKIKEGQVVGKIKAIHGEEVYDNGMERKGKVNLKQGKGDQIIITYPEHDDDRRTAIYKHNFPKWIEKGHITKLDND